MSRIFRYCIHRVIDGQEVIVPIPDVETFLHQRAVARWRAMPLRKRMSEGAISEVLSGALEDAHEALRVASLRI